MNEELRSVMKFLREVNTLQSEAITAFELLAQKDFNTAKFTLTSLAQAWVKRFDPQPNPGLPPFVISDAGHIICWFMRRENKAAVISLMSAELKQDPSHLIKIMEELPHVFYLDIAHKGLTDREFCLQSTPWDTLKSLGALTWK